jgi:hypothetical protein
MKLSKHVTIFSKIRANSNYLKATFLVSYNV